MAVGSLAWQQEQQDTDNDVLQLNTILRRLRSNPMMQTKGKETAGLLQYQGGEKLWSSGERVGDATCVALC